MTQQGNILICDDNLFILQMLAFALESEGLKVETAMSTDEIYRKLENNKPSLIFLDLNIPDAGGESVIHHLRTSRETQTIPVILFSGEEKLKEIASTLKADGFLHKPFVSADLKAIIGKFIPQ